MQAVSRRELFLLTLLLILGFSFFTYILTRYPLIYGVDGPYYLIQVKSLLEKGQLKYGDPPVAFYIFAFFTLLSGGDITKGIKTAVILFSTLSIIPLYLWARNVSKSAISGFAAALAYMFSSLYLWLVGNFLKNAVGVFFLYCFIYELHSLISNGKNIRTLFMAIVFLTLTGATHALDFGVAMEFLILYMLFAMLVKTTDRLKTDVKILFWTGILYAFLAPLFFPFFFSDFYKPLGLVSSLGSREQPNIVLQTLRELFDPIKFLANPRDGIFVLPTLAIGTVLSVYEWRHGRKEAVLTLATVTTFGITIMLPIPITPADWIWRVLVMEFIPISFIIGYCFSKIPFNFKVSAFILLICLIPISLQTVMMQEVLCPTISEFEYYEIMRMKLYIPKNAILFVDITASYWIEYVTERQIARQFSPDLWRKYNVMLVIDKKSIFPQYVPPNAFKIFEGKRFTLYILLPPKMG